jgi:hypothetical protein
MGPTREGDEGGEWLRDERGSGYVQGLVLLTMLALGGIAAVQRLEGTIRRTTQCTGDGIVSMTPGSARCGEGGSPPADPVTGRPIEGDSGDTSSSSPPPPPFPPQSFKDLSDEQQQEYATVLERAERDSFELPDFLLDHRDPRDRARLFDLAANFGLLANVLDQSSVDPESRRVVVESLKDAFDSGSVTPEEFKRTIRGAGAGSRAGEDHQQLADIVVATGDPRIIEAFVEGEIDVVRDHSEDVRRLDAVAKALDALSPEERAAFFERRPDIETVMDIRRRHEDLRRAGLPFVDTDVFTSGLAIQVIENPENRRFIDDMARRYGVDPALLEGVIASEIDFDRDRKDVILDQLGRHGIGIGQGWGVAAVHGDTLDKAIDYLRQNGLPGADEAGRYNKDVENKASFEGSVEAAAIVVAFYADVKQKNGGTIDSPEDMAVIWGAYRSGVAGVSPGGGGFASAEDFAHNHASGTEEFPPGFEGGGNAYQSTPFFEYFKSH